MHWMLYSCFILIHLFLPMEHAIYISVIEITNSNEFSGRVMVKVFKDDLQDAIYNDQEVQLAITNVAIDSSSYRFVDDYFNKHLSIIINDNEPVPLAVSATEINDMSVWLSFRIKSPKKWMNVEVKANYLMELFPTQSNIVNIRAENDYKLMRLTKRKPSDKVSF